MENEPTIESGTLATVPVDQSQTDRRDEHVLIARYPHQMQDAQASLVAWCAAKIEELEHERDDLKDNYEIAVRNKWGASALKRAVDRVVKRVTYYTKMKAAFEAGYSLVPNFPVDIIAIRTTKIYPSPNASKSTPARQEPQILLPGEGEWQNQSVDVIRTDHGTDEKPNIWYTANTFRPLEFPFVMAKPEIYEATEAAMTAKVFDKIGVLPA